MIVARGGMKGQLPKGRPPRSALVIFAKYPRPGRVKTRLCPPLSSEDACRLYEAFLKDAIHAARSVGSVARFAAVTPPSAVNSFRSFLPKSFTVIPQRRGNLGARMEHVFRSLFRRGFGRVCIMGSDHPLVDGKVLRKALDVLRKNEVVLGPTQDGGYYLIGMRRWIPGLFEGIAWSTGAVWQQTVARLEARTISYGILAGTWDVDTAKDLKMVSSLLRRRGDRSSATYRALLGCVAG